MTAYIYFKVIFHIKVNDNLHYSGNTNVKIYFYTRGVCVKFHFLWEIFLKTLFLRPSNNEIVIR